MNEAPPKIFKFKNCKAFGPAAEVELLRIKITDLIAQHPEKAAIILSLWINKDSQKQEVKKAG